ncbi:hypothetical protein [Sutcliffiella horikoshii]|uniref:hypothetical protein n=1 Tax=Sutcliffiella horikoshii TaxID=79883 RepID=UPI003CF29BF4
MENIKAAKQIINFVIPFSFGEPYQNAYKDLDDSVLWSEIESSQRENIMEHIDLLVRRNKDSVEPETIGRSFTLSQVGRKKYGLEKNEPSLYTYKYHNMVKGHESFLFSIPSIRIFLFETQIGFLVYSIKFDDNLTVKKIIEHCYYLKNFSKHYGGSYYRPKLVDTVYSFLEEKNIHVDKSIVRPKMKYGKTAQGIIKEFCEIDTSNDYSILNSNEIEELNNKEVEVQLGLLAKNLVNPFKPETFFHEYEKEGGKYPSYALIYTALTLDQQFIKTEDGDVREAFIKDCLFRMRRSFKGSYKPCARDLRLEGTEEVFQAFENSYWGFSLEGLANLSYLTEDKDTNSFFDSNYYGNLERSYFYLYVIALHQRYALINLSKEATLLPLTITDLMEDKENKIDRLREKIAYFNLRSAFRHVSHISHQDIIYEHIHRSLHIDDFMEKIESEVESIGSLADLQKDARYKKSEKLYLGLTTIFVVMSTISAVWQLFDEFWTGAYQHEAYFAVSTAIILIGLLVIFGRERFVG